MSFHRAHPSPVITIRRDVLLNPDLQPTSRLLYAVLLASIDEDLSLIDAASLAGLPDDEAARPHLDELADAGLVQVALPRPGTPDPSANNRRPGRASC